MLLLPEGLECFVQYRMHTLSENLHFSVLVLNFVCHMSALSVGCLMDGHEAAVAVEALDSILKVSEPATARAEFQRDRVTGWGWQGGREPGCTMRIAFRWIFFTSAGITS